MSVPETVAIRARWVLDTLGARDVALGDGIPFHAGAWAQVERGERPEGDELAEAFWHLARLEERDAGRDRHGRFPAGASSLDPLDPPLERLRTRLGLEPPRWRGARFAVALTHDVDRPWRWTTRGIRNAAGRLRARVLSGAGSEAFREARGLAAVPVHRLRGTDPNWRFGRIAELEGARGSSSTYFLLAGHGHREDGFAPEVYDRLRPRLVETLLETGAEVGLHGSYLSAEEPLRLAVEKEELESLAGPLAGQRYHFLRVDPHANLAPLAASASATTRPSASPTRPASAPGSRSRSGRGARGSAPHSRSWRSPSRSWTRRSPSRSTSA